MLYIIAARNFVGMCSSRSSFYGMPSRVDQDEERPYQGDLADMLRSISGATTRRYSDSYWTHPSHDKFITPGDDDDDPRLFTFQQPDCVDLGGNDPFSASMIRDLLQHGDDDTMISTNNHLYYTSNLLKSNGHGAGSSSSYLNSSSAGTSSSMFEATTEAASITNCIANRPANNSNVFSPVTHAPAPPTSLQTLSLPSSSFAVAGGSGDANNGAANLLSDAVHISTPRNPAIKRRKSLAKKVVCVSAPSPANSRPSGEVVPSDLWAWRKYGQKPIKGSPYPRGYYRCSSSKGCSARKQVERSRTDPDMLVITYTSEHNHPWPTQRNALAGSTRSHSQPSKNNIRPTSSNASRTGAKDGKCNVEEEETARDELTGAAHQTIEVLNTGGGASATYEDWCSQRIYRPTITVGQPDYYYQHVEQTQDDFFAEFGEKDALSYLDWPSSEHQLPLNDGVPEETKF